MGKEYSRKYRSRRTPNRKFKGNQFTVDDYKIQAKKVLERIIKQVVEDEERSRTANSNGS